MKAGFSAFLTLTALALALALGLGLYLGAAQDNYAFAAADERGEASAAEGVVLRSEAELGGDLCLTAEYSPASGENESSSRWIAGGRPREYGAPGLNAYSDYSLLYEWRGGGEAEIENPVHLALYTELREKHATGENSASARLLLNDFTKRAHYNKRLHGRALRRGGQSAARLRPRERPPGAHARRGVFERRV